MIPYWSIMPADQELASTHLEDVVDFTELVMRLRDYRKRLNITEEPDAQLRVTFPIGLPGRPVGAVVPIYTLKKCGTDDRGYKYTLYNQMAYTGFEAPAPTDLRVEPYDTE